MAKRSNKNSQLDELFNMGLSDELMSVFSEWAEKEKEFQPAFESDEGSDEEDEEMGGLKNFLKPIAGGKSYKTEEDDVPMRIYSKSGDMKAVIEEYLKGRGYEDVHSCAYADFVAIDTKDITLGDEVPCKVLFYFVEVGSQDEADNFSVTNEQIRKFRTALLLYAGEKSPDETDIRTDLILVAKRNPQANRAKAIAITHDVGIVRMLLLSRED